MNVEIIGGKYLRGHINVSGAKNAAIPLVCASLLAKGKVLLRNVPRISDISDLCNIIRKLDCKVSFKGHTLLIDNTNLKYRPLLFEECHRIRGSYYLIGVFLTLFSKCEIVLPGGCKIGSRPIDIHLKVFNDLGFAYQIEDGILYIHKIKALEEAEIELKNKSVGASMNAIFASLGLTKVTISNLLLEPEGLDVVLFLQELGYSLEIENEKVTYQKTPLEFKLTKHTIIPDRIETMTYVIVGLMTGDVVIKKTDTSMLELPLQIIKESGFQIEYTDNEIHAVKSTGNPFSIITEPYPGFPTDLQPVFGVLAIHTKGKTTIEERLFENRMHIYYDLIDSGVECHVSNNKVVIEGTTEITSKNYKAFDLRHGAALVILALLNHFKSTISNFEYVLRGYDDIVGKLKSLGACISSNE